MRSAKLIEQTSTKMQMKAIRNTNKAVQGWIWITFKETRNRLIIQRIKMTNIVNKYLLKIKDSLAYLIIWVLMNSLQRMCTRVWMTTISQLKTFLLIGDYLKSNKSIYNTFYLVILIMSRTRSKHIRIICKDLEIK